MARGEMTPLVVSAVMSRPVEWVHPIMLDGLLAAEVARRADMIAPRSEADIVPINVPIELDPGGRFHLASEAQHDNAILSRVEHIHKRAPIDQYATLCTDKVRRVDMSSGPDKGVRKPCYGQMFDRLIWWCVGDADGIRDLLAGITRIGARRRHGCGLVREWLVEPAIPWPGFPLLIDGAPTRPLPLDWPGIERSRRQMRVLTFPYFFRSRQEMLLCPP